MSLWARPKRLERRRDGQVNSGRLAVALAALLIVVAVGTWGRGLAPGALPAWAAWGPVGLAALLAVAGLADGVNPCAFSTMLVYIGATLGLVERAAETGASRKEPSVLVFGAAYAAAILVAYFTFGAGLVNLVQLIPQSWALLAVKLMGAALAVWGLGIVAEGIFPGLHVVPSVPAAMERVLHRWSRRGTLLAGVVTGTLVGVCAIPCSGAIYLAILSYLATLPRPESLAYLAIYNLAYVLPVLSIAMVAGNRELLRALQRLFVRARARIKFGLGLAVTAVGVYVAVK